MKVLIALAIASLSFKSVEAQVENIIAGPIVKDTTERPLYVLVNRAKFKIIDSTYSVDPNIINGIYFLEDKHKSIDKFGEKGKNGAILISPKKEYLARFLKAMNISYNLNDKDPYTQKGSQIYQ